MKTDILKAAHERYEKYLSWLKRQPLSDQTRRAYRSRINHFLGFLGTSGEDIRVLIANAYSAQADRLFRSMAITCSGNS